MKFLAGFADVYFKDEDEKEVWIEIIEQLLHDDKIINVIKRLDMIAISGQLKFELSYRVLHVKLKIIQHFAEPT
ncbi:hypothetical protein [Arachidicoccus sp.]|uniref:hypothetical protein n=1 Tax=Arachidicoccus sp. TaxID=1872624 RepID=UPI003D1D09FA